MNSTSLSLLLLLLFPSACSLFSLGNKSDVIAEVNKNQLRASDISSLIPAGLPREDSLSMLYQYVNTWSLGHLMEAKAQKELPKELKDVSKALEEYRRTLLVFQFEKSYVESRIDTVITPEEIKKIYKDNSHLFKLSEPIVKARYIKINNSAPNIEMVRSLYKKQTIEEIYQLEQMVYHAAEKYDTYNDQWVSASRLSKDLPVSLETVVRAIDKGFLEYKDNSYSYFVAFLEITQTDEIGNLEYEEAAIRNIILGRRKQDLLKKLEKDVLEEGWKTKQLKVYINENE